MEEKEDDDDNDNDHDVDDDDAQVHFNEAIRKAVEEKDRRIQELELSLSNQVVEPTTFDSNQSKFISCVLVG